MKKTKKNKSCPYVCLYESYQQMLAPFDDAERGRLFSAMMAYMFSGIVPEFEGNERFIWPALQSQIDRDQESYAQRCERSRENGKKGGRPKQEVPGKTQKTQGLFLEPKKPNEKEKENENENENEKEKENENENDNDNERENENENERAQPCAEAAADTAGEAAAGAAVTPPPVTSGVSDAEKFYYSLIADTPEGNEGLSVGTLPIPLGVSEAERFYYGLTDGTQEDNHKLPSPSPAQSSGFTPPTVYQVLDYCKNEGYDVDAWRFIDYYSAIGWKLGNSAIRDWKPLVRRWDDRWVSSGG